MSNKIPSFGQLIFNQPLEVKKKLRKLELLNKKLIRAESAKEFNVTCLQENLMPKYSKYIYIYIYTS